MLRRLKNLLPAHAKLQFFKPAILPDLTYCGTAWHFCRASDRRKVERLPERALKIAFNSKLGLKFFVYCIYIIMWHSHYIMKIWILIWLTCNAYEIRTLNALRGLKKILSFKEDITIGWLPMHAKTILRISISFLRQIRTIRQFFSTFTA